MPGRHVPSQISTDIWVERCQILDLDATDGTVHLRRGATVLHLADDVQVPIAEVGRIADIFTELAAVVGVSRRVAHKRLAPA